MAERRIQRRLAAILAADVAGYSRLMGADEVGTLAALKALRREIMMTDAGCCRLCEEQGWICVWSLPSNRKSQTQIYR